MISQLQGREREVSGGSQASGLMMVPFETGTRRWRGVTSCTFVGGDGKIRLYVLNFLPGGFG